MAPSMLIAPHTLSREGRNLQHGNEAGRLERRPVREKSTPVKPLQLAQN